MSGFLFCFLNQINVLYSAFYLYMLNHEYRNRTQIKTSHTDKNQSNANIINKDTSQSIKKEPCAYEFPGIMHSLLSKVLPQVVPVKNSNTPFR